MRLRYQLMLGFLLSLLPVLLVLLIMAVHNIRHFQDQQLAIHAQDTATSLGLALSHIPADDLALADTMLNAIFDRGYYRRISLYAPGSGQKPAGEVLLERENPEQIDGVPHWFIRLFPLGAPAASSEISRGWHSGGRLVVESHPGVGYRRLWAFSLFLGSTVVLLSVLILGVTWLLLRVILTPLHAIERQAQAMGRGEFITVDRVPGTPELGHLVQTLNRMSRTLGTQFRQLTSQADQLREAACRDPQTGLGNAQLAEAQIGQLLSSPDGPGHGYLLQIELASLHGIYEREGDEAAQADLRAIVERVKQTSHSYSSSRLFRLREHELLLLLPFAHRPEVEALAEKLCQALAGHQSPLHHQGVGFIAGCAFRHGDHYPALHQRLLAAGSVARQQKANSCYLPPAIEALPSGGELSSQGIKQLLTAERLHLWRQPLCSAQTSQPVGFEILPRFAGLDDQLLTAGQVVGMAEKTGMVEQLDRLVIHEGLARLRRLQMAGKLPPGTDQQQSWYSFNVSIHSVQSASFLRWLKSELRAVRPLLPWLRLELHESGLLQDLEHGSQFVQQMRAMGVGCAIDHFGINLASFAYLQQLRPNAIKVDGSYIRGVDKDSGQQLFMQVLTQLAAGLEIKVVAGQVESDGEWQQLKQLGVTLGQGYWLGEPEAFNLPG